MKPNITHWTFNSPVPLFRFLLQPRQQRVQTVVVAVQQARWQLAEVGVVLLVEDGEGQVTPGPDVVEDESQHILLHQALELRHQLGEQLDSNLWRTKGQIVSAPLKAWYRDLDTEPQVLSHRGVRGQLFKFNLKGVIYAPQNVLDSFP